MEALRVYYAHYPVLFCIINRIQNNRKMVRKEMQFEAVQNFKKIPQHDRTLPLKMPYVLYHFSFNSEVAKTTIIRPIPLPTGPAAPIQKENGWKSPSDLPFPRIPFQTRKQRTREAHPIPKKKNRTSSKNIITKH